MNNLTLNTKNYTPVDYENLTVKFENNRVYNLATNKDYAGKNKERLIEFCKENKFKYTIFLSFKQAQGLGLKIKKGSKGCRIFAGFTAEKPMQDANGNIVMENADTPKTITEPKSFAMQPVFNIEQLELWTDKEGNKYLNTEFKHNELVDFINNNYQIIENKKVKSKAKALPKDNAAKNTKAKTKKTTNAKDTKASDTKDIKVSDTKDVKVSTANVAKAPDVNTDKIEVINVTSISEPEQKQSEDMNTNNSPAKDFKDIVLTDELKTVIKSALKFVAKTDYREFLKYIYITNINDKLTVLSSDAYAAFRFETDIDLPYSEYGYVSAGIILDKDFKTKLEKAVSIKDLDLNLSCDKYPHAIERVFFGKNKDNLLNTSINLNGNCMELITKTCKELCSKRTAGFNVEIHQSCIMCKLYVLEKFKGNCSIVLSHIVV